MEVFLETERLVLRWFTESDANLLFELDSDPEVVRYAIPGGKTTPYEEIRHRMLPPILSYYERYESLGFWAVIEKSSGRFVGWFVLRPAEDGGMAKALAESPEDAELGYRLKRNAWGKGYAAEGSRALVEKGFRELGVGRVVALADKDNKASVRVMEKVGLRFERSLRACRRSHDNGGLRIEARGVHGQVAWSPPICVTGPCRRHLPKMSLL